VDRGFPQTSRHFPSLPNTGTLTAFMPAPLPRPAPVLRAASPDDIPVIRQLAHDIWWHCYRGMIPDEQIAFMLDWMYAPEVLQESLRTGTHWLIPELAGQPIGFISWSLRPNTRTVHLQKLYLHHAHHGRGIGQFLLAHVRESARAVGAERVELRVNRRNLPAIRAYQRAGFVQLRDLCEDIGNGFVMDDHVLMLPIT
jgi:diamine N-acetyltransferase